MEGGLPPDGGRMREPGRAARSTKAPARKRPPGSSFDRGDRFAYFTANSVRFMKILNA